MAACIKLKEGEEMGAHTENRIRMPLRRQLLVLLPFAFFYTAAGMLGQLERAESLPMLYNLGRAAAWFVCSYGALSALCLIISQREAILQAVLFGKSLPAQEERRGKWYLCFLFAGICLLGYLPYYLMYYPGWLNNDAVWQIEQILGWASPSNHHPYFHTLLMKAFFMIGYGLSGTYTGGMAFYTFCQVVIMATVFGFFLYWLYRSGTRMVWLILAVCFYAFMPVNGLLAICMGKDAFFTAALLLFAWMTVEFDLEEGKKTRFLAYFVTGLLVCLLRSNGVFIFLGTGIVLLFVRGWKRRFPLRTFACVLAVLVCCLLYRGPVLRALQVEPPDTIEGLTMPTQHVLCAYLKGGSLTESEIEMIDRVAPVDQVGDYYNPWLFDPVKNYIRESGDQQAIADHKWDYCKLWLRVGLRNPLQYMVAEVRQTSGYWACSKRDYEYVYGDYYMVDNPFGVTTQRKLFSYDDELLLHDFLMGFRDLYNRVWSLGLNTWLMVFCIAYLAYTRNGKRVIFAVPFLMLLVTLLLAAPVYNEFRYAYGLFAAFPVLFHYTFRTEM